MKHRFSIKEIAFQAGLSLATVDRALHNRPGVRKSTQQRVQAAVRELEHQNAHETLHGRKFVIDIIVEAPKRFTDATQAAFLSELPAMRPASMRARFHMAQQFEDAEILTCQMPCHLPISGSTILPQDKVRLG